MPQSNAISGSRVEMAARRFTELFEQPARVYRAPGRVNLIGEHTDYNEGFVMPAAIGFQTLVAVGGRDDRVLAIYSENYSERVEFDLDRLPMEKTGHWSDYVVGVVRELGRSGQALGGMNLLVDGNVPLGAGLSSSASIEVAVGYALLDGLSRSSAAKGAAAIDRTELALLCQQAENEFVGARCGIMDQFIASHGERDRAMLLDCRSLTYSLLPLPADVTLAICNTMVKHSIAGGGYNQRRAECETGVRALAKHLPSARALRDITLAEMEAYGGELPDVIRRRCRHVITENARVLKAGMALERSDLDGFGKLMQESHTSLRDDFEVSCEELDLMVELGAAVEGVYGTRMTGGGFGGCTIALVRAERVAEFERAVGQGYERATGLKPEIYVCTAADGVGMAA